MSETDQIENVEETAAVVDEPTDTPQEAEQQVEEPEEQIEEPEDSLPFRSYKRLNTSNE